MRKVRLGLLALAMVFAVTPRLNAIGICVVFYGERCRGQTDCTLGHAEDQCQHDATQCPCQRGGGGDWGGYDCDPGEECYNNQDM